jgi:hypothetical protein
MKSVIVGFSMLLVMISVFCSAQSDVKRKNPPPIEERLKMINEKICLPLKLDKKQTETVSQAFKEFFIEIDKLIDFKENQPRQPEKSKVDAFAKVRDAKIKKVIPSNLYIKFQELEIASRPPNPDRH